MTMNMIQRMFAKKIEGEELKKLVEAFGGIGFDSAYLNYEGVHVSVKSYGKLYIQPLKEELNINLEIFVKEKNYFYSKDEPLPKIIGTPKLNKKTFQIKKTIQYEELIKLNLTKK